MSENFFIKMQSPLSSQCDSREGGGGPTSSRVSVDQNLPAIQQQSPHPETAMEDEKNAPKKPDNTELAFKLYDKDKDGFITKSEMSKVSKRLSKEQVDKVMPT